MSESNRKIIPTNHPYYEEETIDIKGIIRVILSHKKTLFVSTFTITLLATIYSFFITPIYQVKADLQLGYFNINTTNGIKKVNLLNSTSTKIYIKNKYDNSKTELKYPLINPSFPKEASKNIINISIQDTSNEKALTTLNTILNDLQHQEKEKINLYINNIKSEIKLFNKQKELLSSQIQTLKEKIQKVQNPEIYHIMLLSIQNYQNKLQNITLKLNNLQERISPKNLFLSSIIGKISFHDYPIKPKKKLIIIVSFVASLIFSIILIFILEFIRDLKKNL